MENINMLIVKPLRENCGDANTVSRIAAMFGGDGLRGFELLIPENGAGIAEGRYTGGEIATLLSAHGNDAQAVYFIADMIEE